MSGVAGLCIASIAFEVPTVYTIIMIVRQQPGYKILATQYSHFLLSSCLRSMFHL